MDRLRFLFRGLIAIGGFVAQINDLGNASLRRAFISKLVAFEVTLLRKTTSRYHPRSTNGDVVEG